MHSEPPRGWQGRKSTDKGSFVNPCPRSHDYFCWYLLYNVWCNTLLEGGGEVCRTARESASSLINTSQRAEVKEAKVNIDLERLEPLRASQVCVQLCLAAAPAPGTAATTLGGVRGTTMAATQARSHSHAEELCIVVVVVLLL